MLVYSSMMSHISCLLVYRITSKYSNALRTLQTCSFAKWYHILHAKIAFEAPWLCARGGIKSFHDIIMHASLNQCWKTLLFEYLAAIRYIAATCTQCVKRQRAGQCFYFQNKIKHSLDTLIQQIFFQMKKTNKLRGDLTNVSAKTEALVLDSEVFFKITFLFFGYFDILCMYLLIIKISHVPGDLSNVLAKMATLVLERSNNSTPDSGDKRETPTGTESERNKLHECLRTPHPVSS